MLCGILDEESLRENGYNYVWLSPFAVAWSYHNFGLINYIPKQNKKFFLKRHSKFADIFYNKFYPTKHNWFF